MGPSRIIFEFTVSSCCSNNNVRSDLIACHCLLLRCHRLSQPDLTVLFSTLTKWELWLNNFVADFIFHAWLLIHATSTQHTALYCRPTLPPPPQKEEQREKKRRIWHAIFLYWGLLNHVACFIISFLFVCKQYLWQISYYNMIIPKHNCVFVLNCLSRSIVKVFQQTPPTSCTECAHSIVIPYWMCAFYS